MTRLIVDAPQLAKALRMSIFSDPNRKKVAIIGAGLMGAGIAAVFASRNFSVSLYSRTSLRLEAAKDVMSTFAPYETIDYTTNFARCVDGAALISENIAEDLGLKRDIFARAEKLVAADCLLTTNTSSISIGKIAEVLERPERFVGLHWFNPAPAMPLIEIVRGPQTSDTTVSGVQAVCEKLGKETIVVARDIPGFLVNRLQYAILREALHLVELGVASVSDVDRAMETTLAPRWAACGPLCLMDLGGLDTVERVAAIINPSLSTQTAPAVSITRRVSSGALGTKTGQGFYNWPHEQIAKERLRRDDVVRILQAKRESDSPSKRTEAVISPIISAKPRS